jgi:hypothetical protein
VDHDVIHALFYIHVAMKLEFFFSAGDFQFHAVVLIKKIRLIRFLIGMSAKVLYICLTITSIEIILSFIYAISLSLKSYMSVTNIEKINPDP